LVVVEWALPIYFATTLLCYFASVSICVILNIKINLVD
jgi:hypothetical protein